MSTHLPIRATITQQIVQEPLPSEDTLSEQPSKPFTENEYKVLTRPVQQEQQAEASRPAPPTVVPPQPVEETKSVPRPREEAKADAPKLNYTQEMIHLETDLKSSKTESAQLKNQLKTVNSKQKESELERIEGQIKDLEATLGKLEQECEEGKRTERTLRDQLSQKNAQLSQLSSLQDDENKLYQEYEAIKSKCLEKDTELALIRTETESMQRMTTEKAKQSADLETEVNRLKEEIEQTKQKYSKAKYDLQDQMLQLTTEVDLLQKELQNKERDSGASSLEQLLLITQENIELLKKRSKTEAELLKQYQEASNRLVDVDRRYTEQKIKYDRELSEAKRRTEQELSEAQLKAERSLEELSSHHDADIDLLKERLQESLKSQALNKEQHEELQYLKEQIEFLERSIGYYQKHLKDLEELRRQDQDQISKQEKVLEGYRMELDEYNRRLEHR
jgi:myosin heavy subunit